MPQTTWHPYAPDQAFGQQAARDEELVDEILDRLDGRPRPVPRAGNKAAARGPEPSPWAPTNRQLAWLADGTSDAPVTTAAALDAAPLVQRRPI